MLNSMWNVIILEIWIFKELFVAHTTMTQDWQGILISRITHVLVHSGDNLLARVPVTLWSLCSRTSCGRVSWVISTGGNDRAPVLVF